MIKMRCCKTFLLLLFFPIDALYFVRVNEAPGDSMQQMSISKIDQEKGKDLGASIYEMDVYGILTYFIRH